MEKSSSAEGMNAAPEVAGAVTDGDEAFIAGARAGTATATAAATASEKPAVQAPGGRFAAAAAAAKAEAAAAAAPPKRTCQSQWDGDCVKPDPAKGPSCGPDWCSKWTTLAPECAGCQKVEEDKKAKPGSFSILDFLHDKQAKGTPPEEAPSVVEAVAEALQTPSVAYQIATPDRQGGRETAVALKANVNAGKRKCQSIWDGDCDRSELQEPLQRPCQSAWDGDCDRSALRELQLPSQGPSREEWASREVKMRVQEEKASREHAQKQAVQDRASLLESSGLDELVPVAVPG